MLEAGTVSHQAASGRLIVKLRSSVRADSILVDSKGRRVAKVVELIGPVEAPYASCKSMTDRIHGILGSSVYVLQEISGHAKHRA